MSFSYWVFLYLVYKAFWVICGGHLSSPCWSHWLYIPFIWVFGHSLNCLLLNLEYVEDDLIGMFFSIEATPPFLYYLLLEDDIYICSQHLYSLRLSSQRTEQWLPEGLRRPVLWGTGHIWTQQLNGMEVLQRYYTE